MSGSIKVDKPRDGVFRITLDHAKKANALTPSMAQELLDIYRTVGEDSSCGCIIIRGDGRHFCSGGDRSFLNQLGANPVDPEHYAKNDSVYRGFFELGRFPTPTIAAVRGAAVGAGLNLMLAADLAIVSEDARIIGGFTNIGIHPGGGHFSLIARRAGSQVAAAISLFGEELSGVDCERYGLAWKALPADQVDDYALNLAEGIARDPALARACCRSLRLASMPGTSWEVALEAERGVQAWSLGRNRPTEMT